MSKKRKRRKQKTIQLPRNKELNLANMLHPGAGAHISTDKKRYRRKKYRRQEHEDD